MNNAETIYSTIKPDLEHYGVLGMKWGTRRMRKALDRAQDKAWSADNRQRWANNIEGTKGSQFRRLVSRPLQVSAGARGASADKASQLAYLKASRKISKWRRRTNPNDKYSLDKLDKLHASLQENLQGEQKIRAITSARNKEHQMRQLNDIYGKYSKGAQIGSALSALDSDTSRKLTKFTDAIEIATAAAPGPRSKRVVEALTKHPLKAAEFTKNVNAGKIPGQTGVTKADRIKRAQSLTGANGEKHYVRTSLKMRYKQKLADVLS